MKGAKTFQTKLFEPGETIIAQGAEGGHLAYIMEGKVEVLKEIPGSEPEVVATLGAGDILGEMSLLTGQPRNASVRAAVKTWIIQVDEQTFQMALSNEELPLMKDMVTQIARRLQQVEAKNMEYLARIQELEDKLKES